MTWSIKKRFDKMNGDMNQSFSVLQKSRKLRIAAAEDISSTAEMVALLAINEDEETRIAAADNPNIPYMCLRRLASDRSVDVRYALAENHNLPFSILQILMEDDNPYVSWRAVRTIDRVRSSQNSSVASTWC